MTRMRPQEQRFWGTVWAVIAVNVLVIAWITLLLVLGRG